MKGNSEIYRAIVEKVEGGYAEVTLEDAPKCTGCAIASACGSRPSDRRVTARVPSGMQIAPGEKVRVKCPPSASQHAMWWGVVVPCIMLVGISILLHLLDIADATVAGIGLAAVAVYYCILALMRKSLNKKLEWVVCI